MELLTADNLDELMVDAAYPAVSLFMPTFRSSAEVRQNAIRCKNLVRQMEDQLEAAGMEPEVREIFLQPVRELIDDDPFWQHQDQGLALFVGRDKRYFCRLPYDPGESVMFLNQFYLKPVIGAILEDRLFYLLALSQSQLRLFRCSRYDMDGVDLDNVPISIDEALRWDDPEKSLQFHTGTSADGQQSARFHGQGTAGDATRRKKDIQRYFKAVDNALRQNGYHHRMKQENAPLMLVGVEELIPLFREANSYPQLLGRHIEKHPGEFDEKSLHHEAWHMMHEYLKAEKRQEMKRFYEMRSGGKTSADTEAVVKSAATQRVEVLFVDPTENLWGIYDPDLNRVSRSVDDKHPACELLNFAVVETLRFSGQVIPIDDREAFPDGPLAAIYRF